MMVDEQKKESEPGKDWDERMPYWRGRNWGWRVLIGLIVLMAVFWVGIKVGQVSVLYGGYGYGAWGPGMMRWNGWGPMMMWPGYYYGYPQSATGTATSTPR